MTEKKLPHDHGQKIEKSLTCMPGTEDFRLSPMSLSN